MDADSIYTTTALQIYAPRKVVFSKIPQKVVFLEILLHWFKFTNYSLYDIKNISKNTSENTLYPLNLGQ